MLPEGAGYVMAKDWEAELFAAGYVRTARELAEAILGWCHICEKTQHPCPTPVHLQLALPGKPPIIVAQRCKRSACPHCGPIYVKAWREHIEEDLEFWLALGGRFQVYWFTQTFDPATHPLPFDEGAAHKRVTRLMADLVRDLRRRYGSCEYTVVLEYHRSGQIHVHAFLAMVGPPGSTDPVLRDRCTAQHRGGYNRHRPPEERLPEGACICTLTGTREPCIQHIAHRLGYGYNNLQRLTSTTAAAKYVTKRLGAYITKTVSARNRPRYARALRMSRHFAVETHGAYLKRICDRYRAKLGIDGARPEGVWSMLGSYSGYMYTEDEKTATVEPRSVIAARSRRRAHEARPPPRPPVEAGQLSL